MQALYFIRSYDELKEEHEAILDESSAPADGQPKGTKVGDPTSAKAIRAEQVLDDILIIERSLRIVPERHRDAVWYNVMHRRWISEYSDSTLRFWKGVFIRAVAEAKKII